MPRNEIVLMQLFLDVNKVFHHRCVLTAVVKKLLTLSEEARPPNHGFSSAANNYSDN
jgi:hypothetical protein